MNHTDALAARIRSSMDEIIQVINRVELLSDKAIKTGDDGYWDGVALNLHGFYVGIERILEDIARSLDESVPEGADWHRALLIQMTAEIGDRRPAVLSYSTRKCLDDYRQHPCSPAPQLPRLTAPANCNSYTPPSTNPPPAARQAPKSTGPDDKERSSGYNYHPG
jgi:hypothetical protein